MAGFCIVAMTRRTRALALARSRLLKNVGAGRAKGDALEAFACALFESVPGVKVTARDAIDASGAEEIDLVLWNERLRSGLRFLPHVIVVECKHRRDPVSSRDICYFTAQLHHRGCRYGILLAAHGITGERSALRAAHHQLALALAGGVRILVCTLEELLAIRTGTALRTLLKQRLCELVASGTLRRQPRTVRKKRKGATRARPSAISHAAMKSSKRLNPSGGRI